MKNSSIVRQNLMSEKRYTPYCGHPTCEVTPRTIFNGAQFECPHCGWQSSFELTFIKKYININNHENS